MRWETKPNYEIIPVPGSSSVEGDAGYIIKLNFGSDALADSIFEITDDVSDSFMRVYSLWVETNALYRVVESINDIYGIISDDKDKIFNNKNLMDFEIIDEQILFDKMYNYVLDLFGADVIDYEKWHVVGLPEPKYYFGFVNFKELLDGLRGNIVVGEKKLENRIPNSYHFGDLLAETVPKLMNLCSDDGNGSKWYTEICFNRVNIAEKFQKIIFPVLEEQNCKSYSFTGEVFIPKKVDWTKLESSKI